MVKLRDLMFRWIQALSCFEASLSTAISFHDVKEVGVGDVGQGHLNPGSYDEMRAALVLWVVIGFTSAVNPGRTHQLNPNPAERKANGRARLHSAVRRPVRCCLTSRRFDFERSQYGVGREMM